MVGPLLLAGVGARPMGLRRIETLVPEARAALDRTVAIAERRSLGEALLACAELYRELRDVAATPTIARRGDAERESLADLVYILGG